MQTGAVSAIHHGSSAVSMGTTTATYADNTTILSIFLNSLLCQWKKLNDLNPISFKFCEIK